MHGTSVLILLKDGRETLITLDRMLEWSEDYPSLDIIEATKAAARWCKRNSAKRKTLRGIEKFLLRWYETTLKDQREKAQGTRPQSAIAAGYTGAQYGAYGLDTDPEDGQGHETAD